MRTTRVCCMFFCVCMCVCVHARSCVPTITLIVVCPGGLLRSIMCAYWKMCKDTGTDQKELDRQSIVFDQALRPFIYSGSPRYI